jgi:hypothetical protein
VVLSLINLVAAGWLVKFWLSHAEWSAETPAYVLLSASLVIALAMFDRAGLRSP